MSDRPPVVEPRPSAQVLGAWPKLARIVAVVCLTACTASKPLTDNPRFGAAFKAQLAALSKAGDGPGSTPGDRALGRVGPLVERVLASCHGGLGPDELEYEVRLRDGRQATGKVRYGCSSGAQIIEVVVDAAGQTAVRTSGEERNVAYDANVAARNFATVREAIGRVAMELDPDPAGTPSPAQIDRSWK